MWLMVSVVSVLSEDNLKVIYGMFTIMVGMASSESDNASEW